ncbi:hypothetical protein LCGC14_0473940 [marine sediment metagenome]|uniref:Uncharacterized protein n=1 Tax=marine sediment metagenome TaxID=412755 RepID=A0A0F9SGK4_9ZZZZ
MFCDEDKLNDENYIFKSEKVMNKINKLKND